MEKVKLTVAELAVESFEMECEELRGTVAAYDFAPTARTKDCPCIELTGPASCG